jgi:hypothetical protein
MYLKSISRKRLRPLPWRSLIVAGLLLATTPVAQSDPLVITRAMTATTIAEFFVERDSVLVELEIGLADLPAFRNLLPPELLARIEGSSSPMAERLTRFFRDDLTISTNGGAPLRGRLLSLSARPRILRDEVTGNPLPSQDEGAEMVLVATASYPLFGRPDTLVFSPPGAGPRATGPIANIGFVVYHEGIPVNDFRYLAPDMTLGLDWHDPWYSRFTLRALRRQFYAPLSAYLYVEPHEVRKEIVLRPRDLQRWTDLGLAGKDSILVTEQEEIKRRVVEFLDQHNQVTIDGRPVEGRLDRVHFIYRTLRTTGVIDPPRDLRLTEALMGVIVYYPVDSLPETVSMAWDLFSDGIRQIPSAATDEAGPLPYILTPEDSVLTWQNVLTNPTRAIMIDELLAPRALRLPFFLIMAVGLGLLVWVTLGYSRLAWSRGRVATVGVVGGVLLLGGAGGAFRQPVGSGDAGPILGTLLTNMYRAFDYREEERIYDTLARSAEGDLLTDVYLEMRRGLELANQGGARAKVTDVEVLEADLTPLDDGPGFASLAKWNVSGSVGHWGHTHIRTNQYEARFTVREVDGAWKITRMDVLQEERL